MQIIGFTGLAGCGKDTAAEFLMNQHYYAGWAFAAPIRQGVISAFGLADEDFADRDRKEAIIEDIGKSPRELMQLFGTEFGRKMLGDDIWVRVAAHVLNQFFNAPEMADMKGLAISDVRFDNEAEYIKSKGGIIVEIVRPQATAVADHVSEHGIEPSLIDAVVVNDGELPKLYEQLTKIANQLELGGLHAIAANS